MDTLPLETFRWALFSATFLCSLVAGFVFAFACVAMPGLGSLNDGEFLRSFQVIDRVIQNNQPLFMLVWVGSIATLMGSGLLGLFQLNGIDRWLIVAATLIYLLGVQLPTMTINIPLNNQLQALDLATLSEEALAVARNDFEVRWNRWNEIRTFFACSTSILLLLLVARL